MNKFIKYSFLTFFTMALFFPPLSNLPELFPGAIRGNQNDDIGSG